MWTAQRKIDMDVGNKNRIKGFFEGEVPNKSRTLLLLASVHTGNDKTRIHEQMLQRMGKVHTGRGQSVYSVAER